MWSIWKARNQRPKTSSQTTNKRKRRQQRRQEGGNKKQTQTKRGRKPEKAEPTKQKMERKVKKERGKKEESGRAGRDGKKSARGKKAKKEPRTKHGEKEKTRDGALAEKRRSPYKPTAPLSCAALTQHPTGSSAVIRVIMLALIKSIAVCAQSNFRHVLQASHALDYHLANAHLANGDAWPLSWLHGVAFSIGQCSANNFCCACIFGDKPISKQVVNWKTSNLGSFVVSSKDVSRKTVREVNGWRAILLPVGNLQGCYT